MITAAGGAAIPIRVDHTVESEVPMGIVLEDGFEERRGDFPAVCHGVAAVAITPGFLRSESMLQRQGVTEDNWRDAGKKDANFLESESPLFVGRRRVQDRDARADRLARVAGGSHQGIAAELPP
jgi:hypothetical protein